MLRIGLKGHRACLVLREVALAKQTLKHLPGQVVGRGPPRVRRLVQVAQMLATVGANVKKDVSTLYSSNIIGRN